MYFRQGRLILDPKTQGAYHGKTQGAYHGPSALLVSQKIPGMVVRPPAKATNPGIRAPPFQRGPRYKRGAGVALLAVTYSQNQDLSGRFRS